MKPYPILKAMFLTLLLTMAAWHGTAIYAEDYSSLVVVVDENQTGPEEVPQHESMEGQGMLSSSEQSESIFSKGGGSEIKIIEWNPDWPYADYSQIHTGAATYYPSANGYGITVCVNAGHGTQGGENYQTLCHPDGSPKVTGGSTSEGAVYATAVSSGTAMQNGYSEAEANLQIAMILKEKLLNDGFNVVMIREGSDVQLDNIARTVIANENADCHLALHYDSSASDKGFFCLTVPDVASYRSMEPVASHWQQHNDLAQYLAAGVSQAGSHIYGSGTMEMDLTQTSYSTIPSVDVECGDTASDLSPAAQERIADGLVLGLKQFFGVENGCP